VLKRDDIARHLTSEVVFRTFPAASGSAY